MVRLPWIADGLSPAKSTFVDLRVAVESRPCRGSGAWMCLVERGVCRLHGRGVGTVSHRRDPSRQVEHHGAAGLVELAQLRRQAEVAVREAGEGVRRVDHVGPGRPAPSEPVARAMTAAKRVKLFT